MDNVLIKLIRDSYSAETTLGKVFIGEDYFSESLEDTVRAYGIKVKGDTAIPATEENKPYKLRVRESPKYGEVVIIYTEEDGVTLKAGGIEYKYVLFHGGNDKDDTLGCVLIAKNRVNSEAIQGTMKKPFTEKIKELSKHGQCFLEVVNLPQSA